MSNQLNVVQEVVPVTIIDPVSGSSNITTTSGVVDTLGYHSFFVHLNAPTIGTSIHVTLQTADVIGTWATLYDFGTVLAASAPYYARFGAPCAPGGTSVVLVGQNAQATYVTVPGGGTYTNNGAVTVKRYLRIIATLSGTCCYSVTAFLGGPQTPPTT